MASPAKTSAFFPLRTINDVRKLFDFECKGKEPNLVLLSIVAGSIENAMTKVNEVNLTPSLMSSNEPEQVDSEDVTSANLRIEPQIDWHVMEALYAKFEAVFTSYCETALLENAQKVDAENSDVRKLIKHVADIIWNTLSKAQYKDRPHLQSIYSYLTGNKLDCFGVAFAVVAACQMLMVPGVHLALSEDHAWVVFGKNGTETAEVTWHGKGSEDKRGQSVEISKAKTSWLYVAGQPVVCDRHMEVAALVSSINPAINANYDSIEVGGLQQELLWLLYDHGCLKQYPMALGNLGDLEEISPSIGRSACLRLFQEAIDVNRRVYNNHHVYPYTYLAGYYYRAKEFSKALETWANAADVIQLYSYSKDDEEIYKEFMEIANDLIPHVLKSEDPRVQSDAQCFANILRFYDGICCWEEGSATPIMHIGWAKPMVSTCAKFEAKIRQKVEFISASGGNDAGDEGQEIINNNYYEKYRNHVTDDTEKHSDDTTDNCDVTTKTTDKIKDEESESSLHSEFGCAKDPIIALLSEYCHSKVLNIDYLLGQSSKPFMKATDHRATMTSLKTTSLKKQRKQDKQLQINSASSPSSSSSTSATSSIVSSPGMPKSGSVSPRVGLGINDSNIKVNLKLKSAKMVGLKDLLCADKLNTNAIQLQLTALSQVSGPNTSSSSSSYFNEEYSTRPKRSRRSNE